MAGTLLLLCIAALAAVSPSTQQITAGVFVAEAHNVSGIVSFADVNTLVITDFYYDGRGPDAYIYYWRPGEMAVVTGAGGNSIPISSTLDNFDAGTPYLGETLTVDLSRAGIKACDIGILSVWCQAARQFFSRIDVARSATIQFTTDAAEVSPTKLLCSTQLPGILLGSVIDLTGNFSIEGTLWALNRSFIQFHNFNYNGGVRGMTENFVTLWRTGQIPMADGTGGVIVPLSTTSSRVDFWAGVSYDNEELIIQMPDDFLTCDLGAVAIRDRSTNTFSALVNIAATTIADDFCNLPAFCSGGIAVSSVLVLAVSAMLAATKAY